MGEKKTSKTYSRIISNLLSNTPVRILILGPPGSGKNYLGEILQKTTEIPFYDTDNMMWKTKYTLSQSRDEKIRLLTRVAKKEQWIIGSVPHSWIDPAIIRAKKIIILHGALSTHAGRIIKRSFHRKFTENSPKESLTGVMALIRYLYTNFHRQDGAGKMFLDNVFKTNTKKSIRLSTFKNIDAFITALYASTDLPDTD